MSAKKSQWNDKHNKIIIKNFEVELYAQDINAKNASNGKYSLLNNSWLKYPQSEQYKLNKKIIKILSANYINKIEYLENKVKITNSISTLEKLQEKIKNLHKQILQGRRDGLDKYGESAVENIAFKVLRRSGHLGKLLDLETIVFDKINSIK